MLIRAALPLLIAGCVAAGDAPTGSVAQDTRVPFHCLNDTSVHVVVCHGSISLFPITVTVDDLSVLSDNQISILSDELDDVALLDDGLGNAGEILDDVETRVLADFVDRFAVPVTRDAIAACTVVLGAPLCQ